MEGVLMQKKIGKVWFFYGRNSGIGLGFNLDKHHITLDLLFWYVGFEF
jgi:hypothetical protein